MRYSVAKLRPMDHRSAHWRRVKMTQLMAAIDLLFVGFSMAQKNINKHKGDE